jgi:hypothetical protein
MSTVATAISDSERFYSLFSKDYLPSYEFFRLFFAKLAKIGITIVDSKKLYSFIRVAKDSAEYSELLQDIYFSFNGISYVSKDIEANLNTLQTLGAIGHANPKYELLLNYFSSESAERILSKYPKYENALDSLAKEYRDYPYEGK